MDTSLAQLKPKPQFGALPWRIREGSIEVLMITSRVSRHWLIPKGWPMAGKSDAQAAAQEAVEEAGIVGKVASRALGSYFYEKLRVGAASIPCEVNVYPLRVETELAEWKEAGTRERRWMTIEEAGSLAFEPGLAELLLSIDVESLGITKPRTRKRGR